MGKRMVTTREALTMLEARGVNVSYSNLALWVRTGKFSGAKQEETPRGPVWKIPADSIERFEPPRRGRTPKATKKGGRK
jgi:hypothetical protein